MRDNKREPIIVRRELRPFFINDGSINPLEWIGGSGIRGQEGSVVSMFGGTACALDGVGRTNVGLSLAVLQICVRLLPVRMMTLIESKQF